jgi:regulator of protease activity HflC (stomatin/prohibitin superfamily)
MMNKKGQEGGAILLVIIAVVFIVGIIVLMLGYDTVEPSHLGVKTSFGQITGVMQPSTQWTGLFTDVHSYDMRTRKDVIDLQGDSYAPTKDGQKIFATINVNYRLKREDQTVTNLYANVGTDDVVADKLNINAIITEGFKEATSQYTAMEVLDKRQDLKEQAITNIKANFPGQYFEIENIVITNIAFSKDYADEIEAKQIAQQAALKEQNQLEVVKFQQQQEIEKYKAQAEQIKLQSQTLTDLTVRQAWIAKWSGNLPNYMIVSQDQSNFLMQLPGISSTGSSSTGTQ